MEKMGKLRTQKHNWRHLIIISFLFYVLVGETEASVNNIEVFVDDMVSIHCYTNAPIDIQWHFNSLFNLLFAGGTLKYPYNVRFRTEYDNGTYILVILKLRSEDAGWYYCSEELTGRRISSTHLTVLYSDLVCYSNMHPDGFIGPNTCNLQQENMVFDCVVSFHGNFPPHLIWRSLNDNRTINSSICDDKPNRRNCSLILTSDPIYDGSIFICQTASIESRLICSTEAIKILYFSSTNDIVKKYVSDNVNCSAHSNLNVKYNWTLRQNNKTTFLSSNQNILIQNPGIYQCEVNYSIRNYSCISIASVMNVSVESTNGGTPSGTTTLVAILSIGLLFVVLCTGMFIFMRGRRKRKRENRRREYEIRENERRENERRENEIRENERRENERRENQRIRNKIEGMYKDFVLEVDPKDILRPLIQKRIISNEDAANVMNKETKEDSCRALLDHLSSSSHREAFIVLRKSLNRGYPRIAARIDAADNIPFITKEENERIKDKVVSMYIDFTSEVDPKNVFDLLIQNRIVSLEDKQRVMNKETAKERCRALIDHLFLCSKENAFIVLREALEECYPKIVECLDASGADNEAEDETVTDKQENERIRNRVVAIYEDFVSEVDPKKVLDFVIQNKIVNVKQGHQLKNKATREEQCEALLDLLYSCSKDNVFVILKESLKEHYPGIVERIDSLTIDDEDQNNLNRRSTMRLESSIVVFGEVDVFKINLNRSDEVSALQQLPFKVFPWMVVAVYCGSVFVTGIRDEIWRFDARNSKWNKCASLMKARLGHSMAFVDHILYVCGGWRINVLDDVEAYDAIDDKCSVVGKLTYAVKNARNCVPYDASLYMIGGENALDHIVNSVQVYNTKLNSCTILTSSMPRNDPYLRAALFENYVILLGKKSCFVYNFETESWEVRDQFKTDVYYFGITVHNEKLFVIGGRDSNGVLRDDVRYVPIVNLLNSEPIEWKHHAKLPKPFGVNAFGKLDFLVKQI